MKKLIVVLVLTMTFAMAACSGKNDNKSSENKVKTDRVEFKSAFSEKKWSLRQNKENLKEILLKIKKKRQNTENLPEKEW